MRTLYFSQELISEYYNNRFGKDLMRYFEIKPLNHNNNNEIAFIGFLSWNFNRGRRYDGLPARSEYNITKKTEHETEMNFIFAGIFYFIILVPQTLGKMFGKEVEFNFYRCTGWPLVSAGLGGALPPAQMLNEASLMPWKGERENFQRMLKEVSQFMFGEISDFFLQKKRNNLNERAYKHIIACMSDKTEEFFSRIKKESEEFLKTFD